MNGAGTLSVSDSAPSFFCTPARLAALDNAAKSWIGTPFFPHGRIKGLQGGVSCQTLCGLIYQEAGFIEAAFAIPEGSVSTGYEAMAFCLSELVVDRFADVTPEPFDPEKLAPGDLVCMRWHRAGHLAIVLPARAPGAALCFIHCLRHSGTTLRRVDDPTYSRLMRCVWRPVIHA